jgi:hypothetical protein
VLGQGVFDSPSLILVSSAQTFFNKGNKMDFKAFGVVFLHNKLDETYQAGHFHKKILGGGKNLFYVPYIISNAFLAF